MIGIPDLIEWNRHRFISFARRHDVHMLRQASHAMWLSGVFVDLRLARLSCTIMLPGKAMKCIHKNLFHQRQSLEFRGKKRSSPMLASCKICCCCCIYHYSWAQIFSCFPVGFSFFLSFFLSASRLQSRIAKDHLRFHLLPFLSRLNGTIIPSMHGLGNERKGKERKGNKHTWQV